jgi:plasmid maintenance system antidote protein VapI
MAITLQRGECRLRELLRVINMKPTEFARRMGVHRSTVSKWMSNKRIMSFEETVLGGRIIGRHAEDFFVWIEIPREPRNRHTE